MASTGTVAAESDKSTPAPLLSSEAPRGGANHPPGRNFVAVDVVLRVSLLASTVASLVVLVTGKQTERIPVMGVPVLVPVSAHFDDSPAFIYLLAALSVVSLYAILTSLVSLLALSKPGGGSAKLLFHIVITDVVMFGILASATGAGGGVAYIGLRGNSHVNWRKVCDVYDEFCRHIGSSVAVSLFASVLLLFLILLSLFSLSRKIPK